MPWILASPDLIGFARWPGKLRIRERVADILEYSEGPLKGAYRVPVRATPKRRETRENLRCLV